MNYIYFYTLGCKLNYTETSTFKRIANENYYITTNNVEEADFIVINTCTVTQVADKKSRYAIRHLKSKNPRAKIIVTGCYAEVDAESLQQLEEVDYIFGNKEKASFESFLKKILGKVEQTDNEKEKPYNSFFNAYSLTDRTRSFLKVQDGCNYFCSYCKVPFARGRSRNAPIQQIVEQANYIASKGIKEIVLTGINIGDFGHSTGETFFQLLQALEKSTGDVRYRISSIEPNLLSFEMIDFVLSSKHFVPHFHVPLQSGSDEILIKMQRKYNVQLFLDKINYILAKNPYTALGIDVIVGFPGETAEHFNQTFNLLKSIPFSYLHVFQYSERKGTKAAFLPDKVSDSVKKERSDLLHQLSNEKHIEFVFKNLHLMRPVLIERKIKDGNLMGFTDNYIKVSLPYEPNLINTIVEVKLKSLDKQNKIVEGEKL